MAISKILSIIVNDPIRKIFAIIFSFGLWFFVAIDSNYQYVRDTKIVYTGLAESLVVVEPIQNIGVTFSGQGRSLFNIWAAPPEVLCNLADVKLGENRISLKELVTPLGFSDVKIEYHTKLISITIDEKAKKQVKISIPLKGVVKNGYAIGKVSVLDTLEISGPKQMLHNLVEITTESLDVKNWSSSFEQQLKVLTPSPAIQISKKIVLVKIEIDTTVEKLFTNIPLKIIYSTTQKILSAKLNLDTLIIAGSKGRIEMMKRTDIEIIVRVINLPVGEYNLPAEIILPDYIKPVYSSPQKFWIRIY